MRNGAAIDALGQQVDADLQRLDVRLTQGGEPTFVSVDDREGAEWNTEAMGPTKRLLSAELMDKLRAKYGQGGLLHYGQGKWYPGEQLPRWSLNLFWRKDGIAVWEDPALFADEHKDLGATEARGGRRVRCTGVAEAASRSIRSNGLRRLYEDVWYYLWRERKLPSNVDPFDARLGDPLGAQAAAPGVYAAAGSRRSPVGICLAGRARRAPSSGTASRWQSGPWYLRDQRCYPRSPAIRRSATGCRSTSLP